MHRPTIPLTCHHDGDAGVLRSGAPRCPSCRREQRAERAEADARRAKAARAEAMREAFERPGW